MSSQSLVRRLVEHGRTTESSARRAYQRLDAADDAVADPTSAYLAERLDATGREHDLLARRVRTNVEQHGAIYTPAAEFEDLGDVDQLIARYNRLLLPTGRHAPRKLKHENGHVFIVGYEDDTVAITEQLQGRPSV